MEDMDRLQTVVQNSNLVATVQEFVPKSSANSCESNYNPAQNVNLGMPNDTCELKEPSDRFQGIPDPTLVHDYSIGNGMKTISDLTSAKSESSKIESEMLHSVFGESSRSGWYSSATFYNKTDEFRSRGNSRYFKTQQNKMYGKWKNSNCNEAINYNGDLSNKSDWNQKENIGSGKTFFRLDQKIKPKDSRNWNQVECFEKWNAKNYSFNNYFGKSQYGSSTRYGSKLLKNEHPQAHLKLQPKHNNKKNISVRFTNNGNEIKEDIKYKQTQKISGEIAENINQREQLINLLVHGLLECLVCCEPISQSTSVWSCSNCYHVLHLKCVIKWAKSSKSDFGWRCPACQNVTDKIPSTYYCFCGKAKDPEWNHQDCPHSCGEVCGKSYRKNCPHKCTLLCHPGPCPQCTTIITKHCGCQKTVKTVQCFNSDQIICNEICGKELNCLQHTCSKGCHVGECENCNVYIDQDCYCQKNKRKVQCSIDNLFNKYYSCQTVCGKKLNCGNHNCQNICHQGKCPECELTPDIINFCPCGKSKLTSLNDFVDRSSCIDPIPTCDLICGKNLSCGPSEKPHTCKSKCHQGPCPDCTLEMMVKCRCGHKSKLIACRELNAQPGGILCEKRCSKKRSCGKHKCNQVCCTGIDHECPLPCNRFLQCGRHRCENVCHPGHCKPCLRASFEELSCECGGEVIYPPIPCGTKPPTCERPCSRIHSCGHPPMHSCHSSEECPPCTVLTKKYCHGRHELRKAVPCHQDSFSCGLPCGKDLECGKHKCILPCHPGSCLKEDRLCSQPCTELRPDCGHICGLPCHSEPCSFDTPCKKMVRVTCECGRKYTTRGCHENANEFKRIATAKLATKMDDLQAGQKINLNDISDNNKKLSFKTLECDDECKVIERNRRLASALQIKNPDLSAKLTPRYSEYLKNWAKRDPRFCQMVHDKLTDLVQLAKQSKQKYRSYSFDPMNREKRHFVHEYSDHFGCESVAYDQEPKRNVVATALKDKSWLPSISIIEFIQKESSPRKVPVPVIAKTSVISSQRDMEVLPSKILGNFQQSDSGQALQTISNSNSRIDYFDWRPQNT